MLNVPCNFILSENDARMLQKLSAFIPEKIFDIHAHLFETAYLPNIAAPGSIFAECGASANRESYERFQCPLYPGVKRLRLNLVSAPDGSMSDRSNGHRARSHAFLIKHLEQNPEDVGEAFVLPDDTDQDINSLLAHPHIKGFKCYHLAAASRPTWQAEIEEYLPESAWRAADERRLCITLHMVKDAALADPGNLRYIREKARQYPYARLILAHAARGFAAWTALEGVKRLSDFANITFDVSAVCEPTAIFAVLQAAGSGRVLWGSDFPVSMFRGKCISLADTFLWLTGSLLEKLGVPEAEKANLVGVENLNALMQACDMLQLGRGDVENIFYHNAMRLFGLTD